MESLHQIVQHGHRLRQGTDFHTTHASAPMTPLANNAFRFGMVFIVTAFTHNWVKQVFTSCTVMHWEEGCA